jgi:endonuclease/exonuclease/phosphatase family metal-dependent hydrolase
MAARTQITFASCNLYNINLPNLPIYSDRDGWDQDAYDKKVAWTSALLTSAPADVWGFQELWHRQALEDVFSAAGLLSNYKLLVPKNHAGQRIVCAGAVRKDLLVGEPQWIEDFPPKFTLMSGGGDPQTSDISVQVDRFSRPVLHFKIRPRANGKAISVYVVHFKSKGPTKIYREQWYRDDNEYFSQHRTSIGAAISTIRRTAEATALRMILTEEMKGNANPVVVLGDCNDGQRSNTLNILTGQPNYLLSGHSKGGSDTALYTVGTLQRYRSLRDVYYTHIYQNTRESLDHILVSQEFYDNSRIRIWAFKGMELINDHLNTDDHKDNGTTDHGIVRATFEYRPAKR